MPQFSEHLTAAAADLTLPEVLGKPVDTLLGVGPSAVTALNAIAVTTVFDLGSSRIFAQAAAAVSAASAPIDMVAADILDDAGTPVDDIPGLPLDKLHGLDTLTAQLLTAALHTSTIRDFANWPPRRLAHDMVSKAMGTDLGDAEEEMAGELRPRFGEYPTERVYYDTLVMLGSGSNPNLTPLTQPLDLGSLAGQGLGFGTPAVGALATYSQSWFAQGVTLGHMVHSLALAPGEATRVAVVDWSRRTSATTEESIAEREDLSSSQNHARAVSEVQNAVAEEMQSGGSIATGWAKSSSKGSGFAGSIGAGAAGIIGSAAGAIGLGFGGSSSKQKSETESRATSTSWSTGTRSVMAEMNQRVNDRTEQHSTSVRNRRASSVREVSQSEHEQVSTRIVANYNHMHALTVQYYEVVQVYRVSVRLNQFTRVLFLPFESLDFSGSTAMDLVARFRPQLLDAALNERVFGLLLDEKGKVEIRGAVRVRKPISVGDFPSFTVAADLGVVATSMAGPATGADLSAVAETVPSGTAASPLPGGRQITVTRPGPVADTIPGDAKLVSISFDDVGVARVRLDQTGVPAAAATFVVDPATDQVDFTSPVLLREVKSIHVARSDDETATGTMVLRYETEGRQSTVAVPLNLLETTRMQKVSFFSADAQDRRAELLAHLQSNRSYYTSKVFANLDSASLVQLLSGLSWAGKPLADQIEPNPVAVVGNYIVLKAPAEDGDPSGLAPNQTWKALLKDRDISFDRKDVRLVPIPTGGVFAEAVLGRSNSAEKLDITRFWNWQDSPIPLEPPEITGVTTGSRGQAENLTPGQLGQPILNLVNPPAVPDPAGLSAALSALANGSMFRDMSGLAGTQATAQAASVGTLSAATEAGRIASENYRIATEQATEMGKAAADMWKVANVGGGDSGGGGGGSGSGPGAGISGKGAQINQGKDMDKRGVTTSGSVFKKASPATSMSPQFASFRDVKEPAVETFSRELDYSDASMGVSPNMLAQTAGALGGGSAPAAAAGGGFFQFLGNAGLAVAARALEPILFAMIHADLKKVGISLGSVKLHPMRKHDNALDFEKVPYGAWTNSSTDIYLNIEQLVELFLSNNLNDAIMFIRFSAVLIVKHELVHAVQFTQAPVGPPKDYKQMVDHEAKAYAADVVWLNKQSVRTFLTTEVGMSIADIDLNRDEHAKSVKVFDDLNTDAASLTDDELKQKMVTRKFLPDEVQGTKNYLIGDLYKTRAP